jgi:hypothetical protein
VVKKEAEEQISPMSKNNLPFSVSVDGGVNGSFDSIESLLDRRSILWTARSVHDAFEAINFVTNPSVSRVSIGIRFVASSCSGWHESFDSGGDERRGRRKGGRKGRNGSGQAHFTAKMPVRKEGGTSARLSILYGVPVVKRMNTISYSLNRTI